MKLNQLSILSLLILSFLSCQNEEIKMEKYPFYDGDDLGLTYSSQQSTFKIWAPTAENALLKLYKAGHVGDAEEEFSMQKGESGTWEVSIPRDLEGTFYAFQVQIDGNWKEEVVDPYAKAVGANGHRGMVVDMAKTNPEAWASDAAPPLKGFEDIIIYELHMRDLSIHPASGIANKGKFLGLAESGTTNPDGLSTGLDHIVEMGVTHVHLLPSFDFRSVDETKPEDNKYNWGYDPQNYNVPEGSYSTNPYDGAVRIKEFKTMVKALHDKGLRVVLDVVYNHTGYTLNSNFNQLVPNYYYRMDSLGQFANGSYCGNETASDKAMMRKFMVESIEYWVNEYHLDGFRFDLMGLHDAVTMDSIAKAVKAIDPSIFIYGEGWVAGDSPLPQNQQANKYNLDQFEMVAAFSDDIRDAIKGHVFTANETGFVGGKTGLAESVKFGIIASTQHPQVDYAKVNYSDAAWAPNPLRTITYTSCHDNFTIWDKLSLALPDANEAEKMKMQKLALSMVLTSQGIPFLHAGSEMARTKQGVENSFESPDEINQIDWSVKKEQMDLVNYVKQLIALRKAHPAFRMTTTEDIQKHLEFLPGDDLLVAYQLKDNANGDEWKDIIVAFNGSTEEKEVALENGEWNQVIRGEHFVNQNVKVSDGKIMVPARGALIVTR